MMNHYQRGLFHLVMDMPSASRWLSDFVDRLIARGDRESLKVIREAVAHRLRYWAD